MSDSCKKNSVSFLKILFLGWLMLCFAIPAPAEEQPSSKPQPPPAAAPPKSAPRPRMAPPVREDQTAEKNMPRPAETLNQKKMTGKIGGQEIRAKEGAEDK